MDKKQMLQTVESDLSKMFNGKECMRIDIVRYDYSKSGIGNEEMKYKVIELLLNECRKQLKEL